MYHNWLLWIGMGMNQIITVCIYQKDFVQTDITFKELVYLTNFTAQVIEILT